MKSMIQSAPTATDTTRLGGRALMGTVRRALMGATVAFAVIGGAGLLPESAPVVGGGAQPVSAHAECSAWSNHYDHHFWHFHWDRHYLIKKTSNSYGATTFWYQSEKHNTVWTCTR